MDLSPWLYVLNLLMIWKVTLGLDRELSCAVCRAVVDEVNYSISKVDPKKTIQVGSFRVDSRGNQGTYEKPYARSEVHLIEVFESVCDNFRDYAETKNEAGGRSVCRTKARDGKTLALKDINISADIQKQLKRNCENLVEEYEDDMIAIFRRENQPNIETVICAEIAGTCTESDLIIPMPVVEYATDDLNIGDSSKSEGSSNNEEENSGPSSEELEEELLKLYENDNQDSISADTVMDMGTEQQTNKEEL